MSVLRTRRKPNLLLAFDAFGTLFAPRAPVWQQYAEVARGFGIVAGEDAVAGSFKDVYTEVQRRWPNYGKEVGMGPTAWWGEMIRETFRPFLAKDQEVPQPMIDALMHRFSSSEGYTRYKDVLQIFEFLRKVKRGVSTSSDEHTWPWPYKRTVVGVITNSDHRVPEVLRSLGLTVAGSNHHLAKGGVGSDSTVDVDFVIASYDVGFVKPDRRIFDAAVQLVEPLEANESGGALVEDCWDRVYVGDEIDRDVVGAMNAGWDAIHIDRTTAKGERVVPMDSNGSGVDAELQTEEDQTSQPFRVIQHLGALRRFGREDYGKTYQTRTFSSNARVTRVSSE